MKCGTLSSAELFDPTGMTDERRKKNPSTVKRSWLPSGILLPMFVAGWISFGFGGVGLYEDREFLSLDSVLAVLGLNALGDGIKEVIDPETRQ